MSDCRSRREKAQALATSLAIRTALVASTVAVALSVPQFAYVTALGGALFGLTVCVCIPAVAFLKISQGCAHPHSRLGSCVALLHYNCEH